MSRSELSCFLANFEFRLRDNVKITRYEEELILELVETPNIEGTESQFDFQKSI